MADRPTGSYCCTTPGALCFWFAAFFVFYGLGLLLPVFWPQFKGYEEIILFAALGLACAVNFGRNRTAHCAITAPIFLVTAVVLALERAGVWDVPNQLVWPVVLIGVGIAFLIERQVTRTERA